MTHRRRHEPYRWSDGATREWPVVNQYEQAAAVMFQVLRE